MTVLSLGGITPLRNILSHFTKPPSGTLGWHRSLLVKEQGGSLVHHVAAQCAILIIYGLVYVSMAIRHRVLLSMLPSPVAVRFGSSQQLIWVIGLSAHRFWGRRETGGRKERAGGKAVRGKG